jgi:hypothetical protein
MQTPNPDIPNILNTPELATPLSFGAASPVVLFPVRLETRFFQLPDGNSELRVRVYPDTVHIDSHEPELTADELTWGKHFWEQTWLGAADEERAKTAWRQLADRFDPPRASWVARALKPLNPEDRPTNPVAGNQPLSKPPRFPSPPTKAEAWTRPPLTRVLPNQWIVLGYKDGRLIVNVKGAVISDVLATGPDPKASPVPANPDLLAIDDGMKWMVDFETAERVGMGIRARMNREEAVAGLDFLLVLGVKDSPAATDWTPRLTELLNAHHYTGGLSFVPHGTPTNNTVDGPSGLSSVDPGHETSYVSERTPPAIQPGDGSNADILTTAFGLPHAAQVFANLPNAVAKEQFDARQMRTALWQATLGYFLLQMLGVEGTNENPLTDVEIAWARNHFIDHVSASGPLPSLRIGKQPYGVLPVTSLKAWKPSTNQQSQFNGELVFLNFLDRLRDQWRRNYPQIPRLGRGPDGTGVSKDLAEVMSMEALSSSYSIRNLMGPHYLEHLWVFLSADYFQDAWEAPGWDELPPDEEPPEGMTLPEIRAWVREQQLIRLSRTRAITQRRVFIERKRLSGEAWWSSQERLMDPLLSQTLGPPWRPRFARGLFSPHATALNGPLVQTEQSLSLSPNYIEALLAARDLDAIRHETFPQALPPSLLYLLLRHSMLLEYAAASTLLQPAQRREPELVKVSAGQPPLTVWDQLKRPISLPGVAGQMELGKYLLGPSGEPDTAGEPRLKKLSDFRASLKHLKSLSPNKLEELMTSTLDLCSHRLDAWITSFATKRLKDMRAAKPTGVLFGGYGWVMNLKPATAQIKVPTPTGEQDPVFEMTNNPGFVHTPSLTQATTAALLLSGHLAHSGNQSSPNDLLAIDLSSERVRLATWLLDGVRQGQPVGALLGYRFERRLQEAGKPEFISKFRELAPLVARKSEVSDQPAEGIAANNVVDGLKLQRLWLDALKSSGDRLVNLFKNKVPVADLTISRDALVGELNALADSVDAVSDALIAESVHQVVRGNPLRAVTTVDSIAGGETPPPELEVVRTPRTGIALTHRLVTLFSGEAVLPPGWTTPNVPTRANAEPHLNAWAAKLLGNPGNVRCVVERLDPPTGNVLETKEIRLNQVSMAPLDLVYAVEGGPTALQSEIEQRILYVITRMNGGFAPGSLLRINPDRKPGWTTADLSYGEFSELLRSARKLITGVRSIDAQDLSLPERNTIFSVDLVELEGRVTAAEALLRRTLSDFKVQFATPDTAQLDVLRGLSFRAASFGVAGAIPLSTAGNLPTDRRTLLAQSASILKELTQRVDQLTVLASGFNAGTATPEGKRDYALARMRILFGKTFVVMPRFTVANAEELEKALADSTKIQDSDPLASTTWLQLMARMRDGVGSLNSALSYSEALNTGEKLKLTIAQLPYASDDRWVGLPLRDGKNISGGKLSIVVQSTAPLNVRQPLAGLLIDEWVEVVPSAKETTGIALQYDQPNAAPPQTILIAVPPDVDAPWTVWSLQQVLLETLDLARVRGVDVDALGEVGKCLPAMYFAFNPNGETVSTDFTKIR